MPAEQAVPNGAVPPAVYVSAQAEGLAAHDRAVAEGRTEAAEGEALDAMVDTAYAAGMAAGRAQAAADIRAHPGPDPSPASPTWWAGYTEALNDCARLAEGPAAGESP